MNMTLVLNKGWIVNYMLRLKKLLEGELNCVFFFNSLVFDPFQSSKSLVFRILPSNHNFISLLHWKKFLIESLITFCFFNFHALDSYQSSRFVVFRILPPNLNFISFLH
jgi:hypothetical protein